MRSNLFREGEIYHVFNKSIANFGIFKDLTNCKRLLDVLDYYNKRFTGRSFSNYVKINGEYHYENLLIPKVNNYIKFISYCIMPDHYHLLIKIMVDKYFSKYISDVENSFSRYFNLKFKRKGPLWQTSFKSVKIKSDEQLLHVSRYIHLNPTTSYLIEKPEDWKFSSYKRFIIDPNTLNILKEISIKKPEKYKKFVEDNKDYQRKLKIIKKLILE